MAPILTVAHLSEVSRKLCKKLIVEENSWKKVEINEKYENIT
jgi:hypothetical protein